MSRYVPKMAGRVAVALLLVLVAGGSVLAAAAVRPSPAALRPAEETAAPTAEAPGSPSTKPAKAPEQVEAPDPDEDTEDADDADATPSPAHLARIVERLAANDIVTTADELAALAKEVGLGGAVRVLLFADASGKTPAEILALFTDGKGWGVIARELALDITPGLGRVMGKGNGPDAEAKAAARAERAAERAAAKAERAAAKAKRAAERAERGNAAGD